MSETLLRSLRLSLASLLTVALAAQLAIGMSRAELSVANFLSFFTILSNIGAVVVMVMLAARPGRVDEARFSVLRGAVTVYMSVTGLVYAVLLAPTGIDVGLTEPWVNWSLHVVGPLALAADWVIHPPAPRIERSALLIWLGFPALYLAYTLVRGGIIDWHPYPFLDPGETDGYGGVAMWASVVLVVILVFGAGYRWWANRGDEEEG